MHRAFCAKAKTRFSLYRLYAFVHSIGNSEKGGLYKKGGGPGGGGANRGIGFKSRGKC
jgi:hypothetical protein